VIRRRMNPADPSAHPAGRDGGLGALLVTLAALASASPAVAQVSFSTPNNIPIGSPSALPSVAVGELNGDSDPDLAVADFVSGIWVLLGEPGGSFSSPTPFAAHVVPSSVTVGEFNGDAHPDLAVANSISDDVSVLLGDGRGSFSSATNFQVGNNPSSVAVGDFNGDTRPDLAVANEGDFQHPGNVSVLLGEGAGNFSSATNFPAGGGPAGPASVAVGDFNGPTDSHLDLAVANIGPDTVSVLLGTGGGSFSGPTDFPTGQGSAPTSVAVGEFNADNHPDLAVANLEADNVSVLLGSGGGSFSGPNDFPTGDSRTSGLQPASVAVGEFNGDSDPDLAVANNGSDDVSVLLGKGGGSFRTPPTILPVGADGPASVAVGDFDGDSSPDRTLDLAVANLDNPVRADGSVSVLLNRTGTPGCAGKTPTVVGTGRPDTLRGTKGDDVIAALGGDDTVAGLRGDDTVCGAGGDDVIRGQRGDDSLTAGTGDDGLRAGGGNDELRGKGGDDTLRGGAGDDVLRGGGGDNVCRGGGGDHIKRHC
jgi:Ca2+-binding RTX toxin-like protein